MAPPMNAVPTAPALSPSLLPAAALRSVAPAAANRPSAALLQGAASLLRPASAAASSSIAAQKKLATARGIDVDALRGVKLKQSNATVRPVLPAAGAAASAQSTSNFLMAALQSKFQRSIHAPYARPRVSMGASAVAAPRRLSHASAAAGAPLATPLLSRGPHGRAASSAFSPMTPADEQFEWTPAR
jgi:hypothetical protein